MERDAFSRRLGLGQGRLRPQGVHPRSGNVVFVLGDDVPGYRVGLQPGDYVEVAQEADLSTAVLIRADLRLRVPASLPEGLRWEVSLRVNETVHARASGVAGRTREIRDLGALVASQVGVHRVALRLTLIAKASQDDA